MRNWIRFVAFLALWLLIGLLYEAATTSRTGQLSYAPLAVVGVLAALWSASYWLRIRAGVQPSARRYFLFGGFIGLTWDIVVSVRKLRGSRAATQGTLRVDGLQARPIDMHHDPAHQIPQPNPAPAQPTDLTWGNAAPGPPGQIPPAR